MTRRAKRSISLPSLAVQVERAAAETGTLVNSWLVETAAQHLKIEVGPAGAAGRRPSRSRLLERKR